MKKRRSDIRPLVDVEAKLLHETDFAYRITDGKKTVWVPKSQVQKNDDGTFTMPEWLAIEKELI